MSITGRILFENNLANIFTGDDINLIIEIDNLEEIFVKEIFLHFHGEVNVKWEDLINKPKDGKIIYIMQQFEGQQICVNKHISIQIMDVLNKGKHCYSVLLQIPQQIPQSIDRKYGSVKYELELGVHHDSGVDVLCRRPLDIKQYLNICIKSEYERPFHTLFNKFFCWGIFNVRPLEVSLTLPTTLFLAGDSIKYFVMLQNFSKFMNLQRLSVILTQTQHYKALRPRERIKQVHTTLNIMMHHLTRRHCNGKFEGSLQLPRSLIPTSQESCLLEISYKLQFILVYKGLHTDDYISLPITVASHRDNTAATLNFTNSEIGLPMEVNQNTEFEV
ncbi:uncharacterized protein LOC135957310 [Calliphora vicina]|uniref:uncharacterized protein LOC135957310 n=1 Tax=Calliphora vicina TaxID=7373 RepID=UPI00325A6040